VVRLATKSTLVRRLRSWQTDELFIANGGMVLVQTIGISG
jgi:hypothetical protein